MGKRLKFTPVAARCAVVAVYRYAARSEKGYEVAANDLGLQTVASNAETERKQLCGTDDDGNWAEGTTAAKLQKVVDSGKEGIVTLDEFEVRAIRHGGQMAVRLSRAAKGTMQGLLKEDIVKELETDALTLEQELPPIVGGQLEAPLKTGTGDDDGE